MGGWRVDLRHPAYPLEAWIEWDGEIREGLSPPMLARAALAKAKGEANA